MQAANLFDNDYSIRDTSPRLSDHPQYLDALLIAAPELAEYIGHSGIEAFYCPIQPGTTASFKVDGDTGRMWCLGTCAAEPGKVAQGYSMFQLASHLANYGYDYTGFARHLWAILNDDDIELATNPNRPSFAPADTKPAECKKPKSKPPVRTQAEVDRIVRQYAATNGKRIVSRASIQELTDNGIHYKLDEAVPMPDSNGVARFVQCRYEPLAGQVTQQGKHKGKPAVKTFRLLTPCSDGYLWNWVFKDELRPLLGVDRLTDDDVLVVSGAKGFNVARALGFNCVADIIGDQSSNVDWSPLAGRKVTLWPDGDAGSRESFREAAALLLKLGATVRWIENTDLKANGDTGGDIVDWVAGGGGGRISKDELKAGKLPQGANFGIAAQGIAWRIEQAETLAKPAEAAPVLDPTTALWFKALPQLADGSARCPKCYTADLAVNPAARTVACGSCGAYGDFYHFAEKVCGWDKSKANRKVGIV